MGMLPPQIANLVQFNMTSVGGIITWVGYGLVFIIGLAVVIGLVHFLSFKFSVTVYPLVGSGNTTELAVGKKRYNRFRWNRQKTAWQSMLPFFNKKQIEPFDPKYIYNGRHIVAFKLGEQYIPGCINISQIENENIKAEINPVPYYIRNWQSIEHKKNAIEFAKNTFWNENKTMIMILIAGAICGAMVLGTGYMTYKFVAPTAQSLSSVASALSSFGNIPGVPPG